jgi:hypothetical protein
MGAEPAGPRPRGPNRIPHYAALTVIVITLAVIVFSVR